MRDLREHRADVIRRLLERGVSAETLAILLPDRTDLIEQVLADPERDR
jgi:hypothetical protein